MISTMRQSAASWKRLVSKPHSFITRFPRRGRPPTRASTPVGVSPIAPPIRSTSTKRRHAEARIYRRRERQRSDGECENESLRSRRIVGNNDAERRGVNRPAERPDHVFDGRPKRLPDMDLSSRTKGVFAEPGRRGDGEHKVAPLKREVKPGLAANSAACFQRWGGPMLDPGPPLMALLGDAQKYVNPDSMFNWTVALMDLCSRGHRLCLVNDRRITRSYPV